MGDGLLIHRANESIFSAAKNSGLRGINRMCRVTSSSQ